MERGEAVGVLKEIISENLGMPSVVSLNRNERCKFDLMLKGDCDVHALQKFVAERNLSIREDKENGYLTIFKP